MLYYTDWVIKSHAMFYYTNLLLKLLRSPQLYVRPNLNFRG